MRKTAVLYSWQEACNLVRLKAKSGKIRHLTVDVFDTLLLRTTPPEAVINGTSRFLSFETGVPFNIIRDARDKAWSIESQSSCQKGCDPDVRSRALFDTWIGLFASGKCPSLSDRALQYELQAEVSCLIPNIEMKELLRNLKQYGLRITALSDMYLSSDEVQWLLDQHGFGELVSDVFTSADIGVQKRTGRLFDWFASREPNIDGVLHIGDDLTADGTMPSSRGIASIVVFDRLRMSVRHRGTALRSWPAYIAAAVPAQVHTPRSDCHRVGFERFGPIYTAFIHGVATKAVSDAVSSVWFMAREGWLLQEIYELVRKSNLVRNVPPSAYLYVSRVSTMRAQLAAYGGREVASVHSDTWSRNYRSTLSPLQLSDDQLADALVEIDAKPDDNVTEEGLNHLRASETFQTLVLGIGDEERKGLAEYLRRSGFPMSGRVAVVDVGWGGQIQENLESALRMIGAKTEIVGYYLGTDERAEERRKRASMSISSIMVDKLNNRGAGLGAFSAVQAIELATRAAHGSVKGYDLDGTPRLAKTDEAGRALEVNDDALIAAIQQGVLAFAEPYVNTGAAIGVTAEESLEFGRNVLDVFSLVPNKIEARIVASMKNVANLGMNETISLGKDVSIWRPRELRRVLRTTLWQEGTTAMALPLWGPVALLLYRRRKGITPSKGGMMPSIAGSRASQMPIIGIIADMMNSDLTKRRNDLARQVPDGGDLGVAGFWRNTRDLMSLVACRVAHKGALRPIARLAVAETRGVLSYCAAHPAIKRIWRR